MKVVSPCGRSWKPTGSQPSICSASSGAEPRKSRVRLLTAPTSAGKSCELATWNVTIRYSVFI
nr:MAG TPA: AAA domain protein [Caudoviricetes sp.]